MFTQHAVFAYPDTPDNQDDVASEQDNEETWVGYDTDDSTHATDEDKYKEDPFGTEWQNKMNSTLLVIRSLPPGHLKPHHDKPSQLNPTNEPTQTHLLVETPQFPNCCQEGSSSRPPHRTFYQ